MEQSQIELALPEPPPANAKALALWLQAQLSIDREPGKISTEPAKAVTWAGKTLLQPSQWRVDFQSPQRSVSAEYWVGNAFVSVKNQDANVFAFITRLHKGVGMSVDWVLLADTPVGGRRSGVVDQTARLASDYVGLGLTSLGLATFFALDVL